PTGPLRIASARSAWTRSSRSHFRRRRCAGHWSNFSMVRCISLLSLAALASPNFLPAQTTPDLSRILERLDRLEQENRTLAGEVQALRAELAASRQPSVSPGAP